MYRLRSSISIAACVGCLSVAAPASASHLTVFAPIDVINGTFAAGGGTLTATTSGGSDDAWLVFAANAGDLLTVTATGLFGPNVVLFKAATNGVVEVGDIYTASGAFDGNVNQVGTGIDLIVQNMMFFPCPPSLGDCYVAPGSATFTVLVAGQYALGISPANDDSGFAGATTITLRGNTASVSPIPEPAMLLLLGTGILTAGLRRRMHRPRQMLG